ncbi:MAG: hypothetical protein HUU10_04400 [Bacteroidetes bacterium]|nr:hypothetical protein [Bacteroidota bacterium]
MLQQKFNPDQKPIVSPLDGKILAIRELSDIESEAARAIDFKAIADQVDGFVRKNLLRPGKLDLNQSDIQFLNQYLTDLLSPISDQVMASILRAGMIGILIADQSQSLKPRRYIDTSTLPAKTGSFFQQHQIDPVTLRAMKDIELQGTVHISRAVEQTKERVVDSLLESMAKGHGPSETVENIRQAITDPEEINRNWRRVAAFEITHSMTNAYLAASPNHSLHLGRSMPDACDHCKHMIDGTLVIKTDHIIPDYQFLKEDTPEYAERSFLWDRVIWPGKTNIGRSSSPKTRDGRTRAHHEQWTPVIPAHPHCRCVWIMINPALVYVKAGQILTKEQNPAEWQKWFDEEATPLLNLIARFKTLRAV